LSATSAISLLSVRGFLRPEHFRTTRKSKKHEGLLNTDEWLIAWFLLEKAHPLVLHCNVNMSI